MSALITECCGMAIGPTCRFCPRCGQEARVEAPSMIKLTGIVRQTAEAIYRQDTRWIRELLNEFAAEILRLARETKEKTSNDT